MAVLCIFKCDQSQRARRFAGRALRDLRHGAHVGYKVFHFSNHFLFGYLQISFQVSIKKLLKLLISIERGEKQ